MYITDYPMHLESNPFDLNKLQEVILLGMVQLTKTSRPPYNEKSKNVHINSKYLSAASQKITSYTEENTVSSFITVVMHISSLSKLSLIAKQTFSLELTALTHCVTRLKNPTKFSSRGARMKTDHSPRRP